VEFLKFVAGVKCLNSRSPFDSDHGGLSRCPALSCRVCDGLHLGGRGLYAACAAFTIFRGFGDGFLARLKSGPNTRREAECSAVPPLITPIDHPSGQRSPAGAPIAAKT
jgi:hypothetical protein